MIMNADAEANAVATTICRRGAGAGAAGNAIVMLVPLVKLVFLGELHQQAMQQNQSQ